MEIAHKSQKGKHYGCFRLFAGFLIGNRFSKGTNLENLDAVQPENLKILEASNPGESSPSNRRFLFFEEVIYFPQTGDLYSSNMGFVNREYSNFVNRKYN